MKQKGAQAKVMLHTVDSACPITEVRNNSNPVPQINLGTMIPRPFYKHFV